MPSERVCVGIIVGAHGVRGGVRIKSYTADPADVGAYGPVADESGTRQFEVDVTGAARGAVLARLSGIEDRDAAEALRGLRLYVPRSALPATEKDEFYHADLVGLAVETKDGGRLGTVGAVHNFGAGDLLDIRLAAGGSVLLPFTNAVVPTVDLDGGRIVVDPPVGLLEPAEQAEGEQAEPSRRDQTGPEDGGDGSGPPRRGRRGGKGRSLPGRSGSGGAGSGGSGTRL